MAETLGNLYYTLGLDDLEFKQKLGEAIKQVETLDQAANHLASIRLKTLKPPSIDTSGIRGLKGELQALEKQWSMLNVTQRRGTEGQGILARFKELKTEAGNYAGTLNQTVKALSNSANAHAKFNHAISLTNRGLSEQKNILSGMTGTLARYFGGFALLNFAKQIAVTTGEFQQLDVAFRILLQSKSKADALMSQMVETAATTPFGLKEVATGAKQLIAYGFAAEDINATLIRLGNIASGLGLPLERLTYLYGTTMTQGRLYTRDLMQFTTSGIPMLQGLADLFGVTTDEVNAMVEAGKVGFPEVQKVIENLTNEGGKFFNLMQEQSNTITGKISNLADAWDVMFVNIGKANNGVISGAIDGTKFLVENYEAVHSILKSLIVTYGAYKATLIAIAAIQKAKNLTENIRLMMMFRKELGLATAAQQAFNSATKVNPYILIGSVLIGIITMLISFSGASNKAAEASAKLSENINQETKQLDELFGQLKNAKEETEDRNKAIESINNKYGSYLGNLLNEKSTVEEIGKAYNLAKKSIIEFEIEKSKGEYLDIPLRNLTESTSEFYNALENFSKELDDETQRGKFKAYIDQIVNAVKEGDQFDINEVYDAFRAAQSDGEYKSVQDWLTAFREDREKYGLNDIDIINKVGGLDVSGLSGFGKQIEIYSKSLSKAKIEFEEFGKAYADALSSDVKIVDPFQNIDNEIEKTKKLISELQQDLSNLLSGKTKSKDYVKDIDETTKLLKDAQDKLNILLGKTGKEGSKDPRVEALEQQIVLLQEAQSMYKELQKYLPDDEAKVKLSGLKAFSGIDFALSFDTQILGKIGEIEAISQEEGKKARESFDKGLRSEESNALMEDVKKSFKDVEDYIKNYKANFDLYEQILGVTGDDTFALKIAFDTEFKGDPLTVMKDELKKISGLSYDDILKLDTSSFDKLKDNVKNLFKSIKSESNSKLVDFTKLIAEFQTAEEKITAIKAAGERERADITANMTGEMQKKALAASTEKENQAVNKLLDELIKGSDLWIKVFSDASRKSVVEIQRILTEAQNLYDYLENTDANNIIAGFGFSEEELKRLKQSPEDIERLGKAIKDLKKELNAQNPFQTFANDLEDGLKKITAGFNKGGKEGALSLADGLGDVSGALQAVTPHIQKFGDDLSTIFGDSNIGYAIDNVIQLAGGVMEAGKGIAEGVAGIASGNPMMIAQGVTSLVSGIAKVFTIGKKVKAQNKEMRDELAKRQLDSYLAEYEINQLYRERYDWDKKIGESTLSNLARQGAELKKQSSANAKEQQDLWNKLMGTEYKANETYKHGTLFRKAKIITDWEGLQGKSWEEIEVLAAAGKLSDEGMKYYEALKKAKEEGEDLAQRQEEYLELARETFTGTAYSGIVDGIIDGFKAGKSSAADFADTFESLMKTAVQQSLKLYAEEQMRDWYEEYARLAEDGLTEEEIKLLRSKYMSLVDDISKKNDDLENITGVSTADDKQSGLSQGIKGESEETASLRNSYLNAIRGSVSSMELYMKNIDLNTAGIYQAMGGSPTVTTINTIPPEILTTISEPFKLNNSLLASIDANMANVHSISANALAQLVMIQANTYNTAMATRDAVEELKGVISPGHPKGGNGIKVWA